jgi:hypothetical protein
MPYQFCWRCEAILVKFVVSIKRIRANAQALFARSMPFMDNDRTIGPHRNPHPGGISH